jgi:hypothetical protein
MASPANKTTYGLRTLGRSFFKISSFNIQTILNAKKGKNKKTLYEKAF